MIKKFFKFNNDILDEEQIQYNKEKMIDMFSDAFVILSDKYDLLEPKVCFNYLTDENDLCKFPDKFFFKKGSKIYQIVVDIQFTFNDSDPRIWGDFISLDMVSNLTDDLKKISSKFTNISFLKIDYKEIIFSMILPNE